RLFKCRRFRCALIVRRRGMGRLLVLVGLLRLVPLVGRLTGLRLRRVLVAVLAFELRRRIRRHPLPITVTATAIAPSAAPPAAPAAAVPGSLALSFILVRGVAAALAFRSHGVVVGLGHVGLRRAILRDSTLARFPAAAAASAPAAPPAASFT